MYTCCKSVQSFFCHVKLRFALAEAIGSATFAEITYASCVSRKLQIGNISSYYGRRNALTLERMQKNAMSWKKKKTNKTCRHP
ncbi:hypothetical protein T08_5918 [Trichinella sp. T8]|nr:hypothetical protein T08_5918 [Trichinella sp. T8]